jgi:hypothetical protein
MTENTHLLVVQLRPRENSSPNSASLELELRVHNPTDRAIRFLNWHTPFEGFANKFMHVLDTHGSEVSYHGMMKSRAAPRKSDYLTVAPGASLACTFNLFEAYPLPGPGQYSAQFFGASMNNLQDSNILFLELDNAGDVTMAPLTIELHAAQHVIKPGAPILVEFAVENLGRDAVTVLPWYTPLDRAPTKCYEVSGPGGEELEFRAPLIDRPAPQPEDHAQVDPGARLTSRMDLRPLYAFGKGPHRLHYVGSTFADSAARVYPLEVYCE